MRKATPYGVAFCLLELVVPAVLARDLLFLFAPDSVMVTVETKYIRPDYPKRASNVERTVTGASRAIIIAGVPVETYSLVGWVASKGCRCCGPG
jgi:hypothetical protein